MFLETYGQETVPRIRVDAGKRREMFGIDITGVADHADPTDS